MESFISSRICLTAKNMSDRRRARSKKDFPNTRKQIHFSATQFVDTVQLDCKHPKGYNNTDGGRRSRSPKTKVEKQLDPRKEFFLKMIGAKITYYRTLRDMSQKELAKRANMSVSNLSKIERGRYNDNVSVSLLLDIAETVCR